MLSVVGLAPVRVDGAASESEVAGGRRELHAVEGQSGDRVGPRENELASRGTVKPVEGQGAVSDRLVEDGRTGGAEGDGPGAIVEVDAGTNIGTIEVGRLVVAANGAGEPQLKITPPGDAGTRIRRGRSEGRRRVSELRSAVDIDGPLTEEILRRGDQSAVFAIPLSLQ